MVPTVSARSTARPNRSGGSCSDRARWVRERRSAGREGAQGSDPVTASSQLEVKGKKSGEINFSLQVGAIPLAELGNRPTVSTRATGRQLSTCMLRIQRNLDA